VVLDEVQEVDELVVDEVEVEYDSELLEDVVLLLVVEELLVDELVVLDDVQEVEELVVEDVDVE
jgi:hypothetical protein